MTEEEQVLLARIDERTKSLIERFDSFEKRVDDHFVTISQFTPVRNLVFGGVGLVITGAVVAILRLVIK